MSSQPGDEFEEEMIKQLTEMFRNMDMPLDEDMFTNLVRQLIKQFESMGVDPESLTSGGVNLNIDISSLKDVLSGGDDLSHIFSNLGFKVEARRGSEHPVDVPVVETVSSNDIYELPVADWYLSGWNLHATIDLSEHDASDEEFSLHLTDNGNLLEIHIESVIQPIRRIRLPQACDDILNWEMNNGIFDMTLHLTPPQNSGVIKIEEE